MRLHSMNTVMRLLLHCVKPHLEVKQLICIFTPVKHFSEEDTRVRWSYFYQNICNLSHYREKHRSKKLNSGFVWKSSPRHPRRKIYDNHFSQKFIYKHTNYCNKKNSDSGCLRHVLIKHIYAAMSKLRNRMQPRVGNALTHAKTCVLSL